MRYKVGDKVVIKEWDEMAREFGMSDKDIDIPNFFFTSEMKLFCGTIMTVERVSDCAYGMKEDPDWAYDDSMIKGLEKEIVFKDNIMQIDRTKDPIKIAEEFIDTINKLGGIEKTMELIECYKKIATAKKYLKQKGGKNIDKNE